MKSVTSTVARSVALWVALAVMAGCSSEPEAAFTGFAPPEAYKEGELFPYYGSENPWDLRFFTEHIETLPQRRGQRQMLDLVRGKAQEAADYASKLLLAQPDDLESLFNLSAAKAQLGQLEQAADAMRRALRGGMPIERFAAGPRQVLRPLLESDAFAEELARRQVSLIHGPMVGAVTADSARFWVRTAGESDVRVTVGDEHSGLAQSRAANDYTAVAEVTGLQPATEYSYVVSVDGVVASEPANPSFRTYPETGTQARFAVGFGGGAGYVPDHERMWDTIRGRSPLAFLFLGDNVYVDLPEMPNALHRYTYYRRQSRPEFRRLTASTAVYAIWDDHDSATDDVWLGPLPDSPPWKLPLFRQFQQNWNNPPHGSGARPGGWFSFVIADVEFFLLDCRLYRTNPYVEPKTMLGPEQKRWLLESLERSESTFKVLASSVPWSFEAKGDAVDTWNGFRRERTEIFDFLAAKRIEGVILISADRHRSDAWRIPRQDGYALYEFESSRLTNDAVHELMPGALFGYNEKQSFGLLTFDTARSEPTVTFEIVSIDDEIHGALTLKRSDLVHAAAN